MGYPDQIENLTTGGRLQIMRRFIRRALTVLVVAVIFGGGFITWKLYSDAAKLTGNKNPLALISAFMPGQLQATNGHINILLAGYSSDDPGHQGADLTDSIMIVSLDATTKSAVVISVPRDLYVNIPGYGYDKINAAYEDGQNGNFSAAGYPSGGMGLLEETVAQDFGVQFGYQALINYTAFQNAVNAVSGVKINIQSSDPRGLYDPNTNLKLPNGLVTLNGQTALNLARARGDGHGSYGFSNGDFDRTEHQQQLLLALKDKATSASILSNPLKAADLADAVGKNVTTNLSIGQIETLHKDTKGMSDNNIKTITLNNYAGQNLVTNYTTYSGEEALVPAAGLDDFSAIQSVMTSLLGGSPVSSTNNPSAQ